MTQLQRRVADFVALHQLSMPLTQRLLDVSAEVGELSGALLKSTAYGRRALDDTRALDNELGDVVFSLICLVNELNVDADALLSVTLDKYGGRVLRGGSVGSQHE